MKTFIVAAVVPIIAVILAWYLANLSEPSLKYQLSSPIEMPQGPGQMAITQQIDVVNVGKASAQPVQLKINKKINKPVVIKDSQADTYQLFDTPTGGTELDYDLLRPKGEMKVIITGDKLTDHDIEIRDQKSLAQPALSSDRGGWYMLADVLLWLGLLYYASMGVRSTARELAYSRAAYQPEEFIRKRKSLLLSKATWDSCIDLALRKLASQRPYSSIDVSTWKVYELLNNDRPKHVSVEEWNKMLPALRDAFEETLRDTAASAVLWSNESKLRTLLSVLKPTAMLESKWVELRKQIAELYLSTALAKLFWEKWQSYDGVQRLLTAGKPDGVDGPEWVNFQSRVQNVGTSFILQSLLYEANPSEFVSKMDLGRLDPKDAERLKKLAYKLEITTLPDVTNEMGAYMFLRSTKPSFITDEDYQKLEHAAKKIQAIAINEEELRKRQSEVSNREIEAASLKKRVLRQLEIIEAFTSDPGTLDGIEDYDDAFAPRNLANLKALGELHKKAAEA